MVEQPWHRQLLAVLHVATLLAALPRSVAAPNAAIPRWDPQRPDHNPGARPLSVLGRPPAAAATPEASLFNLHVGRSAVAKGIGLLVRGSVPRGTVLLESALRVGRPHNAKSAALLDYRAMASINHCWVPNAKLLRR